MGNQDFWIGVVMSVFLLIVVALAFWPHKRRVTQESYTPKPVANPRTMGGLGGIASNQNQRVFGQRQTPPKSMHRRDDDDLVYVPFMGIDPNIVPPQNSHPVGGSFGSDPRPGGFGSSDHHSSGYSGSSHHSSGFDSGGGSSFGGGSDSGGSSGGSDGGGGGGGD